MVRQEMDLNNLVIYHQKRKNLKKEKELLFAIYPKKNNISIHSLTLDHIIPYTLTGDNSLSNLQLLTQREHLIKTKKDFEKIKILKKEKYIEKITNYSMELLKTKEEIIKKFKELEEYDK